MIGRKFNNGMVMEDASPRLSLVGGESANRSLEMWEGDDMTLEMLTDVNESDVDEDVRIQRILDCVQSQFKLDRGAIISRCKAL